MDEVKRMILLIGGADFIKVQLYSISNSLNKDRNYIEISKKNSKNQKYCDLIGINLFTLF